MLIQKLHNNRRKIAIYILAMFSFVFICDFACDQGIINYAIVYEHRHDGATSDHDNHQQARDLEATSDMETPLHGDSCDDDYCEEHNNKLYANLVKHEMPRFDLDMVVLSFEELWGASFSILNPYKETSPHRLNSALSPPVTGLYARILFQSFLC